MDERDRLLAGRNEFEQRGLTWLEAPGLVVELGARIAVLDGLNGLVQLALHPVELLGAADDVRIALHAQPVHLTSELVAEGREQLGFHKVRAEAVEHGCFQSITSDVQTIVAGVFVARGGAAEQVLRNYREAAATGSALHETREEVLRAPTFVCCILARRGSYVGQRLLTGLDPVLDVLIDGSKGRDVLHHPLALRIQARHALFGVRVFEIARTAPDQPADIELVVEDADAPPGNGVDR